MICTFYLLPLNFEVWTLNFMICTFYLWTLSFELWTLWYVPFFLWALSFELWALSFELYDIYLLSLNIEVWTLNFMIYTFYLWTLRFEHWTLWYVPLTTTNYANDIIIATINLSTCLLINLSTPHIIKFKVQTSKFKGTPNVTNTNRMWMSRHVVYDRKMKYEGRINKVMMNKRMGNKKTK